MMNSIFVIAPYRHLDMWVFDDDRVGLLQEPFVSGADTIIDHMVAEIANAANGFKLVFSKCPFPGFTVHLVWQRAEYGGNWYQWTEQGIEGWLCPALFQYFPEAPSDLYAQALPLVRNSGIVDSRPNT